MDYLAKPLYASSLDALWTVSKARVKENLLRDFRQKAERAISLKTTLPRTPRKQKVNYRLWQTFIGLYLSSWQPSKPFLFSDPFQGQTPRLFSRLKWIQPTTAEGWTKHGTAQRLPGPLPIYSTYPSMLSTDPGCQRSTSKPECLDPVVGPRNSIYFSPRRVHRDITGNKPYLPGMPIRLTPPPNHLAPTRSKRAAQAAMVIFSLLGLGVGLGVGAEVQIQLEVLKEEMNTNIDKLTDLINERFAQAELELTELARTLNERTLENDAQNERMAYILSTLTAKDEIQNQRLDLMDARISQNTDRITWQIDYFANFSTSIHTLSAANMELEKIILQTLTNSTGIPLFDRSKAYLIKMSKGIVKIKEYATRARQKRDTITETEKRHREQASLLRELLVDKMNESVEAVEVWVNESQKEHVLLNYSDWLRPNISFEHIEGPNGSIIVGAVRHLISDTGTAPSEVANTIGATIGSGLGALLAPLAPYLLGTFGIIIALGITICVCRRVITNQLTSPKETEARLASNAVLRTYFAMQSKPNTQPEVLTFENPPAYSDLTL